MNFSSYKKKLMSRGENMSQVRRNQSDETINASFTSDPAYKKIYILTKDGWKFEDAKYQLHSTPSILRDAVDYYLQFRPKVHYPIGSYVFVPDDTNFEISIPEDKLQNPFSLENNQINQLWFIVGRDDSLAYVRYNILKCNWNFRWIYNGEIYSCWGANRAANSYTSGIWRDDITSSLDNLTSAWLPDTFYTYGEELGNLGLYDTRTLMHNQRFMLSNNALDPKVYQITKIVDLSPSGIIKISIKQDELNRECDNLELQLCNYYDEEGQSLITQPEDYPVIEEHTSRILQCSINGNELVIGDFVQESNLSLGITSYFYVEFSQENIYPEWYVNLLDDSGIFSKEEKMYYEGLLNLTNFDNNVLSIRPTKANSLKGKKFKLDVSDSKGDYFSSIILEVV